MVDAVRETGATTVFVEPLVSPRVVETVAREAGAQTAVLNPIEGLTQSEQARGATTSRSCARTSPRCERRLCR